MTYDILRNTHFKIDLLTVDKPGYKTLADAKSEDNPASNISYSITIFAEDGRNEILVSNGTYFVELNTTRVYMAGYGYVDVNDEDNDNTGNAGSVSFTITPNEAILEDGSSYKHPAAYVQADYGVAIESCLVGGDTLSKIDLSNDAVVAAMFTVGSDYYDEEVANAYSSVTEFKESFYDTSDETDAVHDIWFKVPSSTTASAVDVNFRAIYSGRVRLRIGDMLKFIPVIYDDDEVAAAGGALGFTGFSGTFAYDKLNTIKTDSVTNYIVDNTTTTYLAYDQFDQTYTSSNDHDWFESSGELTSNSGAEASRELRAMIYPTNADGITKLYLMQSNKSLGAGRDPDDGTLSAGNVVYCDSDVDGNSYDSVDAAADAILDMLDAGYEDVYIEGSGKNILDAADILNAVQDSKDYNGEPFAVDLTEYKDNKGLYTEAFEADLSGLTCIKSLTVGSDSTIKIGTLADCTNLEILIVGSPDNPVENCDKVEFGACTGCTSLKTIIVYTEKDSVTIEQQEDTPYFDNNNGIKLSRGGTITTNYDYVTHSTKKIVNGGSDDYMYFFGYYIGYTYGGETDYYTELYTATGN